MNKDLAKLILRAIVIFLVFELVVQILGSLAASAVWVSIFYGKYSLYMVAEAVALIFALIALRILKHTDILKNKNISFFKSVRMGLPLLVLGIVYFLINCLGLIGEPINFANLISLIIYTILIGLFEEIFFRGILQNELINKYGDSRKKVITSIIICSIIFGCVHLTNLLYGQDLLTTISQVIQTSALGFVLGSVYYLSDNIWSVIFLHGFYDFAVLLSDVNLLKDCEYASVVPESVTAYAIVASLVLSAIYIVYTLKLVSKTNVSKRLGEDVEDEVISKDKEMNKKLNIIIVILIILFFFVSIVFSLFFDSDEEYYICYTYPEITIDKIETHYYSYDDYNTSINEIDAYIYLSDGNVYITYEDQVISLGFTNAQRVFVFDNTLTVISYEDNYKLYYYSDLTNLDEYLEFVIPDYVNGGYLVDASTSIKYPMVKSSTSDVFIVYENNLYVVK